VPYGPRPTPHPAVTSSPRGSSTTDRATRT
jgi:hypothetical protein